MAKRLRVVEQMARYIDAEEVLEAMNEVEERLENCMCIPSYATAKQLVREFPTADVVEVVRCKDCMYSKESDEIFGIVDYKCSKLNTTCLSANDFCSYGKKVE